MLILSTRRFIQAPFADEAELEAVVRDNAEYLFGPASLYLPRALIRTRDGVGTIPDGFAIDLEAKRWYIVEAELNRHNVWVHIAPQIAKQIIAGNNSATRQLIIDLVCEQARANEQTMERFDEQGIEPIDIRRALSSILENQPIIGMPIDAISQDLRDWAATLRTEVRLWLVRKHVEFGQPEQILYEFPEEFAPSIDTSTPTPPVYGGREYERFNITIADLLSAGLLLSGTELRMAYKLRGSTEGRTYHATINSDGSLSMLGRSFPTPSYAALFGIQDAGSDRRTINGWTAWRLPDGRFLDELRSDFVDRLPDHAAT